MNSSFFFSPKAVGSSPMVPKPASFVIEGLSPMTKDASNVKPLTASQILRSTHDGPPAGTLPTLTAPASSKISVIQPASSSSAAPPPAPKSTKSEPITPSVPEYPLSVVRTLTKTGDINRLWPSSIAPGCDPSGALHSVERHWRNMARGFAIRDLQAGRVGHRLEHIWHTKGIDVIVVFNLLVGPEVLKRLDHVRSWDVLKITKSQELFLDSLIENPEWICPVHLTGSKAREREREALENSKAKSKVPKGQYKKPTGPTKPLDTFLPLHPLPQLPSRPTIFKRVSSAPLFGVALPERSNDPKRFQQLAPLSIVPAGLDSVKNKPRSAPARLTYSLFERNYDGSIAGSSDSDTSLSNERSRGRSDAVRALPYASSAGSRDDSPTSSSSYDHSARSSLSSDSAWSLAPKPAQQPSAQAATVNATKSTNPAGNAWAEEEDEVDHLDSVDIVEAQGTPTPSLVRVGFVGILPPTASSGTKMSLPPIDTTFASGSGLGWTLGSCLQSSISTGSSVDWLGTDGESEDGSGASSEGSIYR